MSTLSDNLRNARHHIGMTQEKAARAIGVKRSLLGAWEEGRSAPNITLLPRIIEVYEITDWVGLLTRAHFDVAHQVPPQIPPGELSLILTRYKKLRGLPKDIADLLLKSS